MNPESMIDLLRQHGVATLAELRREPGATRAALARLLHDGSAGIVRLGQGRGTRYALSARILGLPARQPLWLDNQPWGTLTCLADDRLHVAAPGIDLLLRDELPWFLVNFRLQGFLGRAWAGQLGFDTQLDTWPLASVLFATLGFATDPPGAIAMGEPRERLARRAPADPAARAALYDRWADDVTQPLAGGAVVGGAQPKFPVTCDDGTAGVRHLVVKFSPRRGTPSGERWHDLLWSEFLALDTLAGDGIAVADTRVVQSAHRTYLESTRFDRYGTAGKRHVVPLVAVHREFVPGPRRNWAETCKVLALRRRLPRADASRARLLLEYGRMIGNDDMHFGNLSVFAPDPARIRFGLAPSYDMLPMAYRPDGDAYCPAYAPLEPLYSVASHHAEHARARSLAQRFWQRLADCREVSDALRDTAIRNRAALRA